MFLDDMHNWCPWRYKLICTQFVILMFIGWLRADFHIGLELVMDI
jgi:hypothetical protein